MENNMIDKYKPLSQDEFIGLRDFVTSLGSYLPENKATYVWSMYNRLNNTNEPQPCTCASSGKLWKRAIDFLLQWVNDRK